MRFPRETYFLFYLSLQDFPEGVGCLQTILK
jgi:hypothetical protein